MKLLVMRDPVTKLAIVDPTTVDPAVAKLLPSVFFVLNQRIPLTYYISRFTSKGRFGFSENRVMLVSNSVLFVFDDPTGSLNRCIPISAISAVLLFQDGFHALKIPSEHDMVFKLQNVQETNYFVNILSVAKSFLPVPEGQSSNELTVKASGGTYSDLTGRDALVLSKKADAQYATTPIPTIRFVDAQKGDTIAQFLKPPPPPSSKGAAAASVAKDSDKIQQVLQHPLFHPSGVVPKTSEEIKLAQLAVAEAAPRTGAATTKQKKAANNTSMAPTGAAPPAAVLLSEQQPTAEKIKVDEVTSKPAVLTTSPEPSLKLQPDLPRTPPPGVSGSELLHVGREDEQMRRTVLLQKFQHSVIPPPAPQLSVVVAAGRPPPPPPPGRYIDVNQSAVPPLAPAAPEKAEPQVATVVRTAPNFPDVDRLAALEAKMAQLQQENDMLREAVLKRSLLAKPQVQPQPQPQPQPSAVQVTTGGPAVSSVQRAAPTKVAESPSPSRRESADAIERSIRAKPATERIAIRQYHIDQLSQELTGMQAALASGSSVQQVLAIGDLQDELMILAQAQSADRSEAAEDAATRQREIVEPQERSTPPHAVATQQHHSTTNADAQAYAAWYYYHYLPSVAAAQQAQQPPPQRTAIAASSQSHIERGVVERTPAASSRLDDLYSADDDFPSAKRTGKSSPRRRR